MKVTLIPIVIGVIGSITDWRTKMLGNTRMTVIPFVAGGLGMVLGKNWRN